jgi:hypothetical protein
MIQGRWWQACLAVLFVDFMLTIFLPFFISSSYLIYLLSDVIGAFVYSFVYLPYEKHDLFRDPFSIIFFLRRWFSSFLSV